MKIVALSDTHTQHRQIKEVPNGDVLIFAGDLMNCGTDEIDIVSFANWFMNQPHKYKILVAGNHDRLFEKYEGFCVDFFTQYYSKNFHYLHDSGITIEGVKFWGSPYQPEFCNWAFNVERGEAIRLHWNKIPNNTDVLITHGPAYGVLDQMNTPGSKYFTEGHLGCKDLLEAVERTKPKVHIFGHIHGGYGSYKSDESVGLFLPTDSYNASICNEAYKPVNEPHVIELNK